MRLVIILLAVIALGGTAIGLGYAGILRIPGITPAKKKTLESKQEKQTAASAATANATPPIKIVPTPAPAAIPQKKIEPVEDGSDRLAKLWSSLDAESLQKILDKWPSGDTIPILAKMEDDKLAELLAQIVSKSPAKAAQLSKAIKALPKGGK